jgi:type I restriction enzyme S subunit
MSRLEELISELCPDGVEYKTIEEIATDIFRGSGIKRDEVTEEGTPCVRYGEIYTTYGIWFDECVSHTSEDSIASKKYFEYGDILFAITGESVEDIAKSCAYVGHDKCLAGGDIVVLKHNQDPKYLSYALSTTDARMQKSKGKVKSKVVHSSVPAIKSIRIPVPPLEVQREIVQILDKFTFLQAELTAELTARKDQYEFYRKQLLEFGEDVPRMRLGDIGSVCMCKRVLKAQTNSEGGIPFFKIGTFGKTANAFISEELFEEYKEKYNYPKKGDVLISAAGTVGRTVVFDGEPAYFQDSNIVWLDNDETKVLNKFLVYCYAMNPWKVSEGGTIARLYNDNINNAIIPVPSLEQQERIIDILERFDTLCESISDGIPAEMDSRMKQYAYYRDKLICFKEKTA